jgi:hypothetical protein
MWCRAKAASRDGCTGPAPGQHSRTEAINEEEWKDTAADDRPVAIQMQPQQRCERCTKNEYNDYGEEESPRPPPEWPIQPPVQPALGSLPSTTGRARLSLLLTKHAASGSLAQPHRLTRLPATPCGVENESHRHTGVLDHALDLSAA